MSGSSIRRARVAGAVLLALGAVPAQAATPASPAAPTATLAYTAKILITTNVFKRPGQGIKMSLPTHAPGAAARTCCSCSTRGVQGQDLAAGRAARPPERLQRLDPRGFRPPQRRRRWRVTINRSTHLVTVYSYGRKQRSFSSVIGAPATPTPRGLYAIYEKLAQPNPKGFLGPWALHLTAFSNVLLQLRRRPGRVAIHGRDGTSLADPLGLGALARLHPRQRRQHPLDGARRAARHARPDRLSLTRTGDARAAAAAPMHEEMEAIVRFGVLAVVGVASAVVALPHLLTRARRPRRRRCPSCPSASTTCRCASCTCRRRSTDASRRRRPSRSKPTTCRSSRPTRCRRGWCCAPARTHRPASARSSGASCAARISRFRRARARAVRKHHVAPGALALLLHTPHLGSPLLVFSAKGARSRCRRRACG